MVLCTFKCTGFTKVVLMQLDGDAIKEVSSAIQRSFNSMHSSSKVSIQCIRAIQYNAPERCPLKEGASSFNEKAFRRVITLWKWEGVLVKSENTWKRAKEQKEKQKKALRALYSTIELIMVPFVHSE